jgi:hypothetical protein
MKRLGILVVVLGATALLVGSQAVPPLRGHAAAAAAARAAIGNGSVKGIYALSLPFHNAQNGQDGAAVASMVFDGLGGVSGVYSLNQVGCTTCGMSPLSQVPFAGKYVVRTDGSLTLDICLTLSTSETVRSIFEGALSNSFRTIKLVQTRIGSDCSSGGTTVPQPNVSSGTAEKL